MSCNIYTDLGRPDADRMLVKAQTVRALDIAIRRRRLSVIQAAKRTGLGPERLDQILQGRFRGEDLQTLKAALNRLGFTLDQDLNKQPDGASLGEFERIAPLIVH